MRLLVPIVAAISIASFLRETNSHASAKRGAAAYAKEDYATAAREYDAAQQQAPSPRATFNLGTSQIAAADRENGSRSLGEAAKDPLLRGDALYNRGNGALEAKEFEAAIRDYADALRASPKHAAAKRNLEIALRELDKEKQQQAGGGGGRQPQPQSQAPQPQQPPKPSPQQGETDAESILRSVQQQEQEEMRRMKGRAAAGRVGW